MDVQEDRNPLAPEQSPAEARNERLLFAVLVVAGLVVAIFAAVSLLR